jgi:hypothetical protein
LSFYDYKAAQQIEGEGYPFYAIIQAAMRQADSLNLITLQIAFPEVWGELQARYNAPGGLFESELQVSK